MTRHRTAAPRPRETPRRAAAPRGAVGYTPKNFTMRVYNAFCLAIAATALATGPACSVNSSYFPPLTCPQGWNCCDMPANLVCATAAPPCTSCPTCCHDGLNASQCEACDKQFCKGHSTIGDAGCNSSAPSTWVPYREGCCGRGVPLPASTTLPNCLLIGDSTMNGRAAGVASALKDVCQTQLFESVDASLEAACWGAHRASTDGSVVPWDVIFFNEGLHSLYPRTNVSDASGAKWAGTLYNFSKVLATPTGGVAPTLIYDEMTPYMPAHWCNPDAGKTTVEDLNALAVATVTRAGVAHFHDSYDVILSACGGKLYTNCSLCDNEAVYACEEYRALGGFCGFHYVAEGWAYLVNSTAEAIRAVLAERRRAAVGHN